jgi:hypothetical protein
MCYIDGQKNKYSNIHMSVKQLMTEQSVTVLCKIDIELLAYTIQLCDVLLSFKDNVKSKR